MTIWQLQQRQGLPLEVKVQMSLIKIRDFCTKTDGKIYISFSGGKDSTVLLHLVRSIFPSTTAVFFDTGLIYPETRKFINQTYNTKFFKPKLNFQQILDTYGYPVISKEQSMAINRYRNTKKEDVRLFRKYGIDRKTKIIRKIKIGVISKKWHFMIDAPFKISEYCCTIMKKQPAARYHKQTGQHPIIGTMASDSQSRKFDYIRRGCNVYDAKIPSCRPLSFWLEKDIWDYIRLNNIEYSPIYDKGEKNTGCTFCMFGVHRNKENNRFTRMKKIHPKLWDCCINKLGCGKVLDYIGVKYE